MQRKPVTPSSQQQRQQWQWRLGDAMTTGGPQAASFQGTPGGSSLLGIRRTANRHPARGVRETGRQQQVPGAGNGAAAAQARLHATSQKVTAAAGRNSRHLDWAHLQVMMRV
jgi:hypothetical protein